MERVRRMPLSTIGRGFAASTYALSTFLYHAEFCGLPSSTLQFFFTWAARLGPGVPPVLLTGSPCHGGFGFLPLVQHIRARHGAMACRLLHFLARPPGPPPVPPAPPLTPPPPPWASVAAYILRRCCPSLHPAQTLLAAALADPADAADGVLGMPGVQQLFRFPPGPLVHMARALCSLNSAAPLRNSDPAGLPPCRVLSTPQPAGAPAPAALASLVWPHPPSAAVTAGAPPPNRPPPPPVNPTVGPPVAVRTLTGILMATTAARRYARHSEYVKMALGLPANANAHQHVRRFRSALRQAWRIPCTNALKETLWRLAVNSIPGGVIRPWLCPCDLHSPPIQSSRVHSFWTCPVALAVRAQLDNTLGVAVARPSLWLLGPPPLPNLDDNIWRLVSLAALSAMEHGRALLWAHRCSPDWPDPGVLAWANLARSSPIPAHVLRALVFPQAMAARDAIVQRVARSAAVRFWHLLQDFASAHATHPPAGWAIAPNHAFLHLSPAGLLAVNLPPSAPPAAGVLDDD